MEATWRDYREYELASPTNWAEVGKVIAKITSEYPGETTDEFVTVEARGTVIILRHRMKKTEIPS